MLLYLLKLFHHFLYLQLILFITSFILFSKWFLVWAFYWWLIIFLSFKLYSLFNDILSFRSDWWFIDMIIFEGSINWGLMIFIRMIMFEKWLFVGRVVSAILSLFLSSTGGLKFFSFHQLPLVISLQRPYTWLTKPLFKNIHNAIHLLVVIL